LRTRSIANKQSHFVNIATAKKFEVGIEELRTPCDKISAKESHNFGCTYAFVGKMGQRHCSKHGEIGKFVTPVHFTKFRGKKSHFAPNLLFPCSTRNEEFSHFIFNASQLTENGGRIENNSHQSSQSQRSSLSKLKEPSEKNGVEPKVSVSINSVRETLVNMREKGIANNN